MQLLLLVGALAFVMGMAIQRGSTCAVLAVEELLQHRRAARFLGFFECGLWAVLALMLLRLQPAVAPPWSASVFLLGGACLFGLGATVNGGCAFGTIARLGNGRLEYLATGVAACAAMRAMSIIGWAPTRAATEPTIGGLSPLVAVALLAAVMAIRWRVRRRMLRGFLTLGAFMAVIGACGAVLGAIHHPWPWMNTLARWPHAGIVSFVGLVCLVAGAVASGVAGGRFRICRPAVAGVARRFAGGALMGVGVTLIPGGNDALILYGFPSGDPQAILAYLTMLAAIALTLVLTGGISPFWRKPSV